MIIIFKIMILCAPFISKSSESNNSKETAKAAASNHVRHMMLHVRHPGDDYGDDDDDNEGDGDDDGVMRVMVMMMVMIMVMLLLLLMCLCC